MNKTLLLFMLAVVGIGGKLFAQDSTFVSETRKMNDKTYATFNMNQFVILHRHTVYLQKGNKMIVELTSLNDYKNIKDMGAILVSLRNDISFFRDSIPSDYPGSVRIDYTISPTADYHKIRFKKYPANGDMFVSRAGEISKLKLDQDTISFKIFSGDEASGFDWSKERYANMRVTFLLNNYTDIDQLIKDKDTLQHFVDTMAMVSIAGRQDSMIKARDFLARTSIVYRPYIVYPTSGTDFEKKVFGFSRFRMYDYDRDESNPLTLIQSGRAEYMYRSGMNINIKIGAGLVRNRIAPSFDIGPEYRHYWQRGKKDHNIYGVFVAPYFFFDKHPDGNYHTYVAWFVNAEIGEGEGPGFLDKNFERATMGVGYLVNPDGVYFKKITMKAFFNLTFPRGLTFSPEFIFTNNFQNIFPGISVKMHF